MAKAKPSAGDTNQSEGAKTPRKPRAKKEAKLPPPFTAKELTASYQSLPTADLEPVIEKTGPQPSDWNPAATVDATGKGLANDPKQIFSAPTTERTTRDSGKDEPQRQAPTSTDSEQRDSEATDTQERSTTQQEPVSGAEIAGDVPLAVAESGTLYGLAVDGPIAHARIGETRGMCWERLRKEARAAGMAKGQGPGTAFNWATRETDRLFPPPEPAAIPEELPPEPEVSTIVDTAPPLDEPAIEAAPPAPPSDLGVSGLGDLPESWGTLPANAQLPVEIAWVSANRLKVRSGNGVDLSRALSPAPSYSALSWLETSILFPSKFADISVKATTTQDDEREGIRREKLAIEEIRSLLAEMLEG